MSKPGKFRLDTSFEGTFNKFFNLTAPYPVERVKKVLRKSVE